MGKVGRIKLSGMGSQEQAQIGLGRYTDGGGRAPEHIYIRHQPSSGGRCFFAKGKVSPVNDPRENLLS